MVHSKRPGDRAPREPLTEKRLGALDVDVLRRRPPEAPPLRPGPAQTGHHAVSYQISLKLGDGRKDMEQKPTRRRRGVDRLIQDDQVDPEGLELGREGQPPPRSGRSRNSSTRELDGGDTPLFRRACSTDANSCDQPSSARLPPAILHQGAPMRLIGLTVVLALASASSTSESAQHFILSGQLSIVHPGLTAVTCRWTVLGAS